MEYSNALHLEKIEQLAVGNAENRHTNTGSMRN